VASRLVKRFPSRLHSLVLVDPVCFGMFMPHLLHNFFYRRLAFDLGRWAAHAARVRGFRPLLLHSRPHPGRPCARHAARSRPLPPNRQTQRGAGTLSPRTAAPPRRPKQLLLDLLVHFASRDLHLAAAFSRRFYWSDVIMWPEELPPGSTVVLGAEDDLVHADEVRFDRGLTGGLTGV
jgi:hypothetical protein